jgi:uncharacterized membrane protein
MKATRPVAAAGLWIGLGMGGFVDGILFHQILQFHSMLSARIPTDEIVGAKVSMVWDGVFHACVWSATAYGVALLWRAAKTPGTIFSASVMWGAIMFGWGLFNFVEGVIDHHILHLHHVYEPAGLSIWDYLFLACGLAMLVAGWLMMRGATNRQSIRD